MSARVAINDLFSNEALAYLLKHDTVMGTFEKDVCVAGDVMSIDGREVSMLASADQKALPWKTRGIDVVVEATGWFRSREGLEQHLQAGRGVFC